MALPSEEIKQKLDIVRLLKDYLDLRPAGRNFKAHCPFHQEKSPSFIVSPERQIWHCFGCGEGGDIFKFVMKYENVEFYEALKILAEKAGVELRNISPSDQKQFGILYDINSAAAIFWNNILESSKRAWEYLGSRGLKRETVAEFEIGFAPNEFDILTLHLLKEGFSMEDIVRAGLAFKTEKGKYIDRFRGRVMFPIHNNFGKVVGFSGRVLPEFEGEGVGKYVNSPETPIFNKSRLLYGFFKAKNFIRDTKTALLVEGQMDFLMMWQAGVKNLVATSGTSLTADHLKVLRKMADNVVVAFDKDEAGIIAAERAIDLAGAADLGAYVLDFGNFKDPAEAAEKSPALVLKVMQKPTPAMEYYFSRYLGGEEKPSKENIRTLLKKVKNLWSRIERANWIRELSHKTGVPPRDLEEELERVEALTGGRSVPEEVITPVSIKKNELTRFEHIILRTLSLVSINEGLSKLAGSHVEFLPHKYRMVYSALAGGGRSGLDSESGALLDMVSLRSSLESGLEEDILKEELVKLLKELELEYWKEKRREAGRKVLRAEEEDADNLLVKLKEFDDIVKKIQYIENGKKT